MIKQVLSNSRVPVKIWSDVVMENQKDLVKVVAQLKQFMCIKG